MDQNINFELYKVFYTVAKELSFSKASKSLFISQSAISQSIRQLEAKLDTSLFNRSTKQVRLTKDGEKLLEHIEPAIHMIRSGEQYIMETKSLERGQLHIGASDTICKHYLLDFIKAFHQKYPQVEIKITNRTSIRCVELLQQGAVDLIVSNLPNEHLTADMNSITTYTFNDVFICNKNRDMPDGPYSLETLAKEPILMLTKATTTSEYLYKKFTEKNISITPAVELGSIDLLVDMAKIDLGIAFVPDFCIESNQGIQILELVEPIEPRHLGVVTQSKKPLSEASKKFIELFMPS